jgi:hypothetical protein
MVMSYVKVRPVSADFWFRRGKNGRKHRTTKFQKVNLKTPIFSILDTPCTFSAKIARFRVIFCENRSGRGEILRKSLRTILNKNFVKKHAN